MFCHSSVDHAAISVIPPLHPDGWVKTVVRTNGLPGVVSLGAGVVNGVTVDELDGAELDDTVEVKEVEDLECVELRGITPEVITPIVSS